MKLTPIKNYTAHYPNKEQVDLNGLLLRHTPNRWKTSGAAILLFSALTASQLTGCFNVSSTLSTSSLQSNIRKMNMAPIFEGTIQKTQNKTIISTLSFQSQKVNIVPLGNYPGPGSFQPLTEETALAIIKETLEEHGLSSSVSNKKVDVPLDNKKDLKWSFDLEVKGAKEPVYIEFLLQSDVENENEFAERNNLNLSHDTKEAAVDLREKLSEVYDDSTGAIFYENSSFMVSGEGNLIEQVNEFVEWLKTMGLI